MRLQERRSHDIWLPHLASTGGEAG
jgi:hypothetical protein